MSDEIVISLQNCQVSQQKNQLILSDIDLELKRGEFAYLIGRTGSGKSSLLKLLYGDLPLLKGDAKVVGIDLKNLKTSKIPDLRRHLGIVFQDFQLLSDRNVQKNLLFVLKATNWKDKIAMDERIDEVLDMVSMTHKKNSMPFELSGGEQQRIAIARSLLNNPELILADEPTGNLDPITSKEIMNLLLQVSKDNNCAVLMATHDFDIIRNYPAKTLKCEDAKISLADADAMTLF